MSVVVDLVDLPDRLAEFDRGYLLTARDGLVKAVSVRAAFEASEASEAVVLRVPAPGRGSLANVGANPQVTLLFPPTDGAGLTLLVDGSARSDGEDVLVSAVGAVLHRAVS